jgi:lipid II:glycine glycyltransferase (peptidoglycan interpeptide bridge formation enzyme)
LRVRLLRDDERAAWNRFAGAQAAGHLLQSWEWGAFKARWGWQAGRVVVERADHAPGDAILAGVQVLLRQPVARVPFKVAYVPRGPLVDPRRTAPRVVGALWGGLHHVCRRRRAVFCKIEPNLPAAPALAAELQSAGFRPADHIQPLNTILLDLAGSEDDLLGRMKPKTRYNIRLAGRRGVQVSPAATEDDLRAFHTLMLTTGARDEFVVRPYEYYRDAWRGFTAGASTTGNDPAAVLLLATHPAHGAAPIAGLMVFAAAGEAIYMYGGSSDAGREHMPNYLLQWEAIRWARARGCRTYDFWGIPDDVTTAAPDGADDNPNVRQGLWGVYRFKQGFGGREQTYAGGWDYIYNPLLYYLYQRMQARRAAGGLAAAG